jgi:hypothetical protein
VVTAGQAAGGRCRWSGEPADDLDRVAPMIVDGKAAPAGLSGSGRAPDVSAGCLDARPVRYPGARRRRGLDDQHAKTGPVAAAAANAPVPAPVPARVMPGVGLSSQARVLACGRGCW